MCVDRPVLAYETEPIPTGTEITLFSSGLGSLRFRHPPKTAAYFGQGKYVLITAEDGGIVNEPVLLRIGENRWWLALSDSDAGLWARGYAVGCGLDVTEREPEIYPVQVQGPKSAHVMTALFGEEVTKIRYYWTMETDLDGIPVVISRTGWSAEVGFEIHLRDPGRGEELWDRIMEAGARHRIRPIAPSQIRRIEAGIFRYGADMTIDDNPFEVMGLERLVEDQSADYIGKDALMRIRAEGVSRKLVGIVLDGQDRIPGCPDIAPVRRYTGTARRLGRSRCWSGRRACSGTSAMSGCRSGWRRPATR